MHQSTTMESRPSPLPMHIRWLVDWRTEDATPETSPVASIRYRVALPARALEAGGHRIEIVKLQALHQGQPLAWEDVDVLIVGKLFVDDDREQFSGNSRRILEACHAAHRANAKVIADINDDHFERPDFGEYWKSLAQTADVCIVGSAAMGKTVSRYTHRPVTVVGDPLASPKSAPRVQADRSGSLVSRMFRTVPLKLVWYGNLNNVGMFIQWMQWLGRVWTDVPLQVRMVTSRHPTVDAFCTEFNAKYSKHAQVEFIEWSEDAQWSVVADSDIVLIPSDASDVTKAVKTANRLTDALHAGRYVIASPVPSYLPYADFVDLGNNPVQALHTYLKDPAGARDRIARGQAAVERQCGMQAIANEWLEVIRKADRQTSGGAKGSLKLNLGCGDKILDGYVNVDVAPSRGGRAPDVLCDLHDLSTFSDGSADEILSVHVVEHFWRWEVENILREWLRVLKPGGRMVLECPNLASACEEFLRDPEAGSSPGKAGQKTMWVFYGDPSWQDPLMVHRWGYTPASLCRLMETVGLVDVHQEPAEFKQREPRDMRIVGRRPG